MVLPSTIEDIANLVDLCGCPSGVGRPAHAGDAVECRDETDGHQRFLIQDVELAGDCSYREASDGRDDRGFGDEVGSREGFEDGLGFRLGVHRLWGSGGLVAGRGGVDRWDKPWQEGDCWAEAGRSCGRFDPAISFIGALQSE